MTAFLPPNLLALFAPRDPLHFLPPTEKLPHEKKRPQYTGVAQYLDQFEESKYTPAPVKLETKEERKERRRREKAELQAYRIEQGIAMWNPRENPKAESDPYKTLFISRVNYDTSESKLRREFEAYGPIKKITIIQDAKTGKPRGYAFVEYKHERDMHAAYKHADGKKIDGRRVLVDVERGRTVKGWLPRRLGGGLGSTRRAKNAEGNRESRERSEQRRERDPDNRDSRDWERDRGDNDREARRRSRSRSKEPDRDRSERDRSEHDRSDRDRDRGERDRGAERDRGDRDRSDRGDRGDRGDRSDRDRDRYRGGDKGGRFDSRYGGRDNRGGGGGGGSGGGGDRRYDNRDRDRGYKDREQRRESGQDFSQAGNGNY